MNLNLDEIVAKCLAELISTKENTVELFNYQLSRLTGLGKTYYINFLKSELSEITIDKLLEEAYSHDFKNVILIKEPVVKISELSEEEIYNLNHKFIDKKGDELHQILYSLENNHTINAEAVQNQNKPVMVNTFKWRSTTEALYVLYQELIENYFIPEIDFETFKTGFRGVFTQEPLYIPWIKIAKNKKTSKISLFYLLEKLQPNFIKYPYSEGYSVFTNVFCDKDYKPFVGIKQSRYEFENSNHTDPIIDKIIDKLESLPENSKVR